MTKAEKIIDFSETDILSLTFSSKGLKYLSLKDQKGSQSIKTSVDVNRGA